MSTKNFILKIQSPTSATSSKDYILVLNTKFTTIQFISDLQELYPPTKEDKLLVLMLQGTYRMTPRQFLGYMWDNVDYKPTIRNGIYRPSMFGGSNVIKIVYEEVESIPIAELAPVAPKSTREVTQNPAATSRALVKAEKAIVLPSNSKKTLSEKNIPQPQDHRPNEGFNALRPTHANTPHEITFDFHPADENSPLKKYDLGYISVDVPVSGGREQCIQLLPQIQSGLRKWLDPSAIEIVLVVGFGMKPRDTHNFHIDWNEDLFLWKGYGTSMGKWVLYARAIIYEKNNQGL